jgi:hypothetical protein
MARTRNVSHELSNSWTAAWSNVSSPGLTLSGSCKAPASTPPTYSRGSPAVACPKGARPRRPSALRVASTETAAAAVREPAATPAIDFENQLGDCDRKLAQYRAALDAGADPASLARWITETEAERARIKLQARQRAPKQTMTTDEITAIVNGLADLLLVLREAEPADKTEIYSRLGLRLTYQPDGPEPIVRTEVSVMSPVQHWSFERVRGAS